MRQILALSKSYKQKFNIQIPGYSNLLIYMEYKPLQHGWFMDLLWQDFSCSNERISNHPNLLRQFQNILPFGLLCSSYDETDPLFVDSWVTTHTLWVLDQSDFSNVDATYARV